MKLFLFIFFLGCAGTTESLYGNKSGSMTTFSYEDATGNYKVLREIKQQNGKFLVRNRIFQIDGQSELENTVSVSKLGYLKGNKDQVALLPEASQYKVWFEKKEHKSSVKINSGSRQALVQLDIEEEKPTQETLSLPKARYVCYFSQLPECLRLQKLLIGAARKKLNIYVLWDSYPFNADLYESVGKKFVSLATVSLSDHNKSELKFSIEVENQIIFIHFNRELEFTKMFWVAQGISMIRKGEQ